MESIILYFLLYLLVINIVGFASMGIDKSKAERGEYRISEKALFQIALLGGGVGSTVGMNFFRHKTKHWYFVIGMPAIVILEVCVACYIMMLVIR